MPIPLLFGRYLVREGKLSENQLSELLTVQSEINRSFSAKAIEGDFITIEEFKKGRQYQRDKGVTFRQALMDLGFADEKKVQEIEDAFADKKVKLGELMIRRGLITEEELHRVIDEFRERGVLKGS